MSELELVAGKQVERADFSSADNRSVRPPSLSEVEKSHRRNLRRLAFSGFHGLPPKISDGQQNSVFLAPADLQGDTCPDQEAAGLPIAVIRCANSSFWYLEVADSHRFILIYCILSCAMFDDTISSCGIVIRE